MRHLKAFLIFIFVLSGYWLFAQNDWLWGKCGKGYGEVIHVAIDNSGNCFSSGYLFTPGNPGKDTLVFSTDTLFNNIPNTLDALLIKYDRNGNYQWARQTTCLEQNLWENGFIVSTDAVGNSYLSLPFSQTMLVGAYTLAAGVEPQTSNT